MKPFIYVKSEKKNYYSYNLLENSLSLCHPYLLEHLCFKNKSSKKKDPIFEIGEIETYYKNKAKFLLEKGLVPTQMPAVSFDRLSAQTIELTYGIFDQIIFEITEKCNLRCQYCTFGSMYNNYEPRINRDMKIETAVAFIEHVKPYWMKHFNSGNKKKVTISFIGGEPLLNISFIKEFIDYLNTLNLSYVNFTYKIITNGLLVHKHIDYFITNNIFLQISIDGNIEDNIYRKYPNNKSAGFDIINSIDYLHVNYNEYFQNNISFNSVIHNKNTKESASEFLFKRYKKYPNLSELVLDGIVKESDNQLINDEYNYDFFKTDSFRKSTKFSKLKMFLAFLGNTFYQSLNDVKFDSIKCKKSLPSRTCIPFSQKVYITANGRILPCEVVGFQYEIGTILNSIVNINFENIAKIYNDLFDSAKRQCMNCYKYKYCHQCLLLLKDFDKNQVCTDFKNSESIKKDLSSFIDIIETNTQLYYN